MELLQRDFFEPPRQNLNKKTLAQPTSLERTWQGETVGYR